MNSARAIRDLEKLRKYRVRPERAGPVSDEVQKQRAELERLRKSLKGAGEAWGSAVPAVLAERCRLVTLARGVLTVRVEDAATGFELDRFLRSGGLRALQKASSVTVTRVKILN